MVQIPRQWKKWESVLMFELTSTDEDDYEDGKEILISHQISWLSNEVNNFKQVLHREILKKQRAS